MGTPGARTTSGGGVGRRREELVVVGRATARVAAWEEWWKWNESRLAGGKKKKLGQEVPAERKFYPRPKMPAGPSANPPRRDARLIDCAFSGFSSDATTPAAAACTRSALLQALDKSVSLALNVPDPARAERAHVQSPATPRSGEESEGGAATRARKALAYIIRLPEL